MTNLVYIQSVKYLELNLISIYSFLESVNKSCSHASKAQPVLNQHIIRHRTMSVEQLTWIKISARIDMAHSKHSQARVQGGGGQGAWAPPRH